MPTIPSQSVSYRWGTMSSLEMVNVLSAAVRKTNFVFRTPQVPAGTELRTVLTVRSWVRNTAFTKDVWLDVHVFDGDDQLIHSETFTMHSWVLMPAAATGLALMMWHITDTAVDRAWVLGCARKRTIAVSAILRSKSANVH